MLSCRSRSAVATRGKVPAGCLTVPHMCVCQQRGTTTPPESRLSRSLLTIYTGVQLPSLGSAMCACTWHFFYNAPELGVCFLLPL